MVRSDLPGERRRLAHARRHGFSRATEERLAETGRRLPPPSEADRKIMAADRAARLKRRLVVGFVVLFVVALVVGGAVQWLRPVSDLTAERGGPQDHGCRPRGAPQTTPRCGLRGPLCRCPRGGRGGAMASARVRSHRRARRTARSWLPTARRASNDASLWASWSSLSLPSWWAGRCNGFGPCPISPPSEADRKIMAADRAARLKRRLVVGFVVLFVVALVVGGAVQWLRPVSDLTAERGGPQDHGCRPRGAPQTTPRCGLRGPLCRCPRGGRGGAMASARV